MMKIYAIVNAYRHRRDEIASAERKGFAAGCEWRRRRGASARTKERFEANGFGADHTRNNGKGVRFCDAHSFMKLYWKLCGFQCRINLWSGAMHQNKFNAEAMEKRKVADQIA